MRERTVGTGGDRAVSEVLGYTLIVGLMLTAFTLVYMNGIPAVQDTKQAEQIATVQSVFTILNENVMEVVEGDSTARRTELDMAGGSLGIGTETSAALSSQVWVNVSVEDPSGTELCPSTCNTSMRPLIYELRTDRVVYEAGSVISVNDANRSAMVEPPNWHRAGDGLILTVVATRGSDSVAGDGVFSIGTEQTSTTSFTHTNSSGLDVTITVDSPWPGAWESYFATEYGPGNTRYVGPNTVEVTLDPVTKVIYSEHVISVELD